MRGRTGWLPALGLLACVGCGTGKSTDGLIADPKSSKEGESVSAARNMPRGAGDAAKIVPALAQALTHPGNDVRRSSALKLGEFRDLARDAIPALEQTERQDKDARVREAAHIALSRIDPERFPRARKVGRR